ncbi:MAG: PfkB family carbohydrate kinase [Candidatus Lokiarchaeota archaeon]
MGTKLSIIKNNKERSKVLIGSSDIVSLNMEEASEITEYESIMKIIKKLEELGVQIVSITNGINGSVISDGKAIIRNFVHELEVHDTTGS